MTVVSLETENWEWESEAVKTLEIVFATHGTLGQLLLLLFFCISVSIVFPSLTHVNGRRICIFKHTQTCRSHAYRCCSGLWNIQSVGRAIESVLFGAAKCIIIIWMWALLKFSLKWRRRPHWRQQQLPILMAHIFERIANKQWNPIWRTKEMNS